MMKPARGHRDRAALVSHRTARRARSFPCATSSPAFNPKATQRVLYVTHWDTRPTADDDPVLGNRSTPIPGANDGAAGVGLFVALGDALKKTPPDGGRRPPVRGR